MKKIIEIDLSPFEVSENKDMKFLLSRKIHVPVSSITGVKLLKRSIDARKQNILIHQSFEVWLDEVPQEEQKYNFAYQDVSDKPRVIIVGAGPAGLFAALRLIELGLKPVVVERGKTVEERKFDITAINRKRLIDPDSNYCFGEGGAGTYSDGKLYTRSTKKGDVNRILHIFHLHGANQEILIDSHPHIGTDKLPQIIAKMRTSILDHGGELQFGQRISDIIIRDGKAIGVVTNENTKFEGEAVILATGHSAHDVYEMLSRNNILIEAKPFAVGVRVEHPQSLIDSIQYHSSQRDPNLPAATYTLTSQAGGRGVFSFCMCPGGTIVTASTSQEELVLNGMSNSQRNQPFANSGIVVTVDEKDFKPYEKFGPLAGLKFQEAIEKNAFLAGGSDLKAPAQKMTDFLNDKLSATLNETSYFPGVQSAPLHEILPKFITSCLKEAFGIFNKKMKGFVADEATLLGVETRTSSPVRIPRNNDSLEHTQIANLYPCGEGSGYAGGIVSSAIDGERCAELAARKLL